MQQPPNTVSTWHAEAAQICISESTKEVASKVGDLVHTSLQPAFDLGKRVTLLVITNSGSLGWGHQQAAERLAGAVPSRAPWTIRVVAQDEGTEEARSTRSCLPKVQCRVATDSIISSKSQR